MEKKIVHGGRSVYVWRPDNGYKSHLTNDCKRSCTHAELIGSANLIESLVHVDVKVACNGTVRQRWCSCTPVCPRCHWYHHGHGT